MAVKDKLVSLEVLKATTQADVSDLKSATTISVNIGSTSISGKTIVAASGGEAYNDNYVASNFIDIHDFAGYNAVIGCYSWSNDGVAFYDKTQTFITNSGISYNIVGGTRGSNDYSCVIPDNAYYVRFSTFPSLRPYNQCFISIVNGKAVEKLAKKATVTKAELDETSGKINGFLGDGTYQTGSGSSTSGSDFSLPISAVSAFSGMAGKAIKFRYECTASTFTGGCRLLSGNGKNLSDKDTYYSPNTDYIITIGSTFVSEATGNLALYCAGTKVTASETVTFRIWMGYDASYNNLVRNINSIDNTGNSWYKGKKISVLGDSITYMNKWQPYVAEALGCTFQPSTETGVGGSTVSLTDNEEHQTDCMYQDARVNTIDQDADVVLFFGGHNDLGRSHIDYFPECTGTNGPASSSNPLSGWTLTDNGDVTEFCYAYALALKKIQTRCPNAKIITMSCVGGRVYNASNTYDFNYYWTDGTSMMDYANAVKWVSAYFGIPCIDVGGESGINIWNAPTYLSDTIHPNDAGGKLIANLVVRRLMELEPIVFE